jgi:hypothetical protein
MLPCFLLRMFSKLRTCAINMRLTQAEGLSYGKPRNKCAFLLCPNILYTRLLEPLGALYDDYHTG